MKNADEAKASSSQKSLLYNHISSYNILLGKVFFAESFHYFMRTHKRLSAEWELRQRIEKIVWMIVTYFLNLN